MQTTLNVQQDIKLFLSFNNDVTGSMSSPLESELSDCEEDPTFVADAK